MRNVTRLSRPMPPPSESARLGCSSTSTGVPARSSPSSPRRAPSSAYDTRRRSSRLDGCRHPGRQPATRDGYKHHGNIGHLRHDLESERPLPCDDRRMVEGRHHYETIFRNEPFDFFLRLVWELPTIRTLAPRRLISETFVHGTRCDMQIVASEPSAFAA